MNHAKRLAAAAGLLLAASAMPVSADEKPAIKLGVVGPFTGPFAVMGEQWRQGIETYLSVHGNVVNGRRIEVIYRDTTGNPATAKQITQELVTRDKVSFLGGYGLTPEANASVQVINQNDDRIEIGFCDKPFELFSKFACS